MTKYVGRIGGPSASRVVARALAVKSLNTFETTVRAAQQKNSSEGAMDNKKQ